VVNEVLWQATEQNIAVTTAQCMYMGRAQRDKQFCTCENVQRVKKNLDTAKLASTQQLEVCRQTDRHVQLFRLVLLYTHNFSKLISWITKARYYGIKLFDVNWNVCLDADKYSRFRLIIGNYRLSMSLSRSTLLLPFVLSVSLSPASHFLLIQRRCIMAHSLKARYCWNVLTRFQTCCIPSSTYKHPLVLRIFLISCYSSLPLYFLSVL